MAAPLPALKPSDVVFMNQAPKAIYTAYGATVLAWGGTSNAKSIEEAASLKFFRSVGMVTEFNRHYERFPESYEAGLCRDLNGMPYKVPWLTDHPHKGVPYWWCCTRQPLPEDQLRQTRKVLVLEEQDFSPADRAVLTKVTSAQRLASVEDAIARVGRSAQVQAENVRVFRGVKPGNT